MQGERIILQVSDKVAIITLNSPTTLNALDSILIEELSCALNQCEENEKVKAIIIEGSGKGFSSGGDLTVMAKALQGRIEELGDGLNKLNEVALKLRSIEKPIIASIHGACAGAGWNLALLCDFRFAAKNAKFVQSFVKVGLIPDMGGSYVLTKLAGVTKATELFMTGKMISSEEAEQIGLVTTVVSEDELFEATISFAKEMTNSPNLAIAEMKALMNQYVFADLESALLLEYSAQMKMAQTNDFKEGVMAFIEKRQPNFGRN